MQPSAGHDGEPADAQEAAEDDAGIEPARNDEGRSAQDSEEGGSSAEEDDELEAPSIASGDDSEGGEEVSHRTPAPFGGISGQAAIASPSSESGLSGCSGR